MEKQLKKHTINHRKLIERNAPEREILDVERKIEHYKDVCDLINTVCDVFGTIGDMSEEINKGG
jgi:hypothetical protein